MTVFVQFGSAYENTVVGACVYPQPAALWPYQSAVDEEDPRYLSFLNLQKGVTTESLEKLKAFLAENPAVAAHIK